MEEFHRIRRLPPYVFEQVNRAKAAARNAGADIIDLGMGNPDCRRRRTWSTSCEDARQAADRPLFGLEGHPGLRRAQAAYYARRFGVKLNPENPDRRDARLQGGLRQRRPGDHRAGRRRAGAGSELSDPCLRLPDGGRRHPLGAGSAGPGLFRQRSSARSCTPFQSRSRLVVCYPSNPDRLCRRSRFYKDWSRSRRSTDLHAVRSRLRRGLFR